MRHAQSSRFTAVAVILVLSLIGSVVVIAVLTSGPASPPTGFSIENAFPNLSFKVPVGIYHAGDSSNRLFVLEKGGIIKVFQNSVSTNVATVFLNLTDRVESAGSEEGLLGLAFHPRYASSGIFFVDYTAPNPLRTVIARYQANPSISNQADPGSERIIIQIDQPFTNHNGGQLAFGPDGYLYIAMGDGGGGGDPYSNAQNRSSLLGKILRIDVNHESPPLNYSIPIDNPFVGNAKGYRGEIYAYGLRNPWRFSFDTATGKMWCGDVGQGRWEEVDIIEKGANYGWNIMEGNHCYPPGTMDCNMTGLRPPVWEYDHSLGDAITGGFIYRGSKLSQLTGKYIYGDYGSGRIWSLQYNGPATRVNTELIDSSLLIASFGVDQNNELYICDYNGNIYTLSNLPM